MSQTRGLEEVVAQLKQQLHLKKDNEAVKHEVEDSSSSSAAAAAASAAAVYEARAQLRGAHDEIFRLKNELTKLKLDLKAGAEDLTRQQQKYRALQETSVDYSSQLQKSEVIIFYRQINVANIKTLLLPSHWASWDLVISMRYSSPMQGL